MLQSKYKEIRGLRIGVQNLVVRPPCMEFKVQCTCTQHV